MNTLLHPKLQPLLLPIKLDALGLFFINFLIPIVAHQQFNANGWQMGLLFSLQAIGMGCSALLFSGIVNKWANRRSIIGVGAAIKALSYAALYFAIIETDYLLMVVATFGLGFGAGMFWLVWQTCFAQLSEFKHRAEVLGEASKQIGTGILWGSVVAFTLLSAAQDYKLPDWQGYLVLLGFCVASAYAAILSYQAVGALTALDAADTEHPEQVSGLNINALTVFLFSLIFIGQLSGSLVAPFLEVYLLDQLNITNIGDLSIAYIPGGIISLMVAPKLGRFADRINPALFLACASVIGAATTWLMLQVTELWQISVLFVIDASVITSAGLVLVKLISELAGEEKGKAFGLQGFITNLGAISGPLLGGVFWQVKGATGPLLFSIAVEAFLAISCLVILLPLLKRNVRLAAMAGASQPAADQTSESLSK